MPWLTIIMALLSFFISKKSGASNTKALLTAGLVGAGTYYVSHETDWGKANLGSLDGVASSTTGSLAVLDADGKLVVGATGVPLTAQDTSKGVGSNVADVLKSWGGVGTATVVGTTAAAGGGFFSSKNMPYIIGAGILLALVLK